MKAKRNTYGFVKIFLVRTWLNPVTPAEETIGEGAMLAALLEISTFWDGSYWIMFEVSKIRKPNGAKPGFAQFERPTKYLYYTPDPLKVEALEKVTNRK